MTRWKWLTMFGLIVSVMALGACATPPKKALSDAQKALLDARGVKDCADDKYKAAKRLLDEAEKLSAQKKYDEAERKAKAAKKLALEAKAEGKSNWEKCKKQQELANKAEHPEPKTDEQDQQPDEKLTLETVHFDYDSSELSEQARSILQQNARWIKEHADRQITLEGHTDERGTTEYNLALGENRARTVRQFLIQLGVDASRLSILSYGEEKPVAFGATPADYAKNRRVEFVPR